MSLKWGDHKDGTHKAPELFPVDAADAVRRWDGDEIVWTVEMGGIGPGYEQCIQMLVMEIIRDNVGVKLDPNPKPDDWAKFGEDAITRLDPKLQFSGSQVGAAKNLAYRLLKQGWIATLNSVSSDRRIQVRKNFPRMDP